MQNARFARLQRPHALCVRQNQKSAQTFRFPADHTVLHKDNELRTQYRNAPIVQDFFSHRIHSYLVKNSHYEKTVEVSSDSCLPRSNLDGPTRPNRWNSKKLARAQRAHDTSTLHCCQTNGIAERAARRARKALQQRWSTVV